MKWQQENALRFNAYGQFMYALSKASRQNYIQDYVNAKQEEQNIATSIIADYFLINNIDYEDPLFSYIVIAEFYFPLILSFYFLLIIFYL